MRWDRLFDDYEARLAAQQQRDLEVEGAEEALHQRSRITMAERLLGHRGSGARLGLITGEVLEGRIQEVGTGWVMVLEDGEQSLIPLTALSWWEPQTARAVSIDEARARTMPLTVALRALVSSREIVRVQVLAGASVLRLHGVLVGIGADYAEIALVPEGQRHQVRGPVRRRILPLAGLCTVTSTAAAPGAR